MYILDQWLTVPQNYYRDISKCTRKFETIFSFQCSFNVCVCVYMYVYACACACEYVRMHMCICNQLPWQLGFTPTISRGVGGALYMVLIINQTGSANPLQVSCTYKFNSTRVSPLHRPQETLVQL